MSFSQDCPRGVHCAGKGRGCWLKHPRMDLCRQGRTGCLDTGCPFYHGKKPAVPPRPVPRPRTVPRPGFPVLINNSFGGLGLSRMAIGEIKKVKPGFDEFNFVRHDPDVIAVVTRLGLERSQDRSSTLEIVYCTEGRYFIDEYDGAESMVQPSDIEEKWISKE